MNRDDNRELTCVFGWFVCICTWKCSEVCASYKVHVRVKNYFFFLILESFLKALSEENEHFMVLTHYDKHQKACKSKVRFINTKSENTPMLPTCDKLSWPKYSHLFPERQVKYHLMLSIGCSRRKQCLNVSETFSHTALPLNMHINQSLIKGSTGFNI